MRHRRQIVPDEEIANPERLLQLLQLVHDLGADRYVEGRDRLVEHDQPCMCRQRAGSRDPLTLAAAELVRKQPGHLGSDCGAVVKLDPPAQVEDGAFGVFGKFTMLGQRQGVI